MKLLQYLTLSVMFVSVSYSTVIITSPQQGAAWYSGETYTVKWLVDADNGSSMGLCLTFDDQPDACWYDKIESTPNDGSYSLTVTGKPVYKSKYCTEMRIRLWSVSTNESSASDIICVKSGPPPISVIPSQEPDKCDRIVIRDGQISVGDPKMLPATLRVFSLNGSLTDERVVSERDTYVGIGADAQSVVIVEIESQGSIVKRSILPSLR